MGDWLRGAIDLHIHSAPDSMERYGDAIQIAQEAAAKGMRAIVLKDHLTPSIIKARLAQRMVPDIHVFGGICLNSTVGGLNLRMVLWALKCGAKVVMMPTMDSAFTVHKRGQSLHARAFALGQAPTVVEVLTRDGTGLRPEVDPILDVVAEHNLILSTGHLGPDGEAQAVVERAREKGITKIVVEHPNMYYPDHFTLDVCKQLADMGAYLCLSFGAYNPLYGHHKIQEAAEIIRAVGAERCILITDLGQIENPPPTEGLRVFCECLYKLGISESDIRLMTTVNRGRLLDLAPEGSNSDE